MRTKTDLICKMTRAVKGRIIDNKFAFPFRMILAGSSGAGKTYFAGELLKRHDIFEDYLSAVHYYFPCYLSEAPVQWHKTLDIPVSYHVGLPTKSDLMQLPRKSCVVIDDSFDEALKSSAIDHLFRVISGKRNICVMIMTQNNFSKGKYGREIRNSCNFSVLFRNCCDVLINENIARMAGMKKAYDSASLDLQGQKYPYMLLDQSQKGQLSPYRLYTNIFSRFPVCYSVDGMKAYVIGAQDFELFFNVFSKNSKFTANEIEKPQKRVKAKKRSLEERKTAKKAESKEQDKHSDLEWESDSEWETRSCEDKSIAKSNSGSKRRSKQSKSFHQQEPRVENTSTDFEDFQEYFDGEQIRRRFQETLY